MLTASLLDPTLRLPRRSTSARPLAYHLDPLETHEVAEHFLSAPTTLNPLVVHAYQQLEIQTDRMFALLTDHRGPYRLSVVPTSQVTPYTDAGELIESVLSCRTLEVTTVEADRTHPRLGCEVGGGYFRFRAVHDLIGHVATGFGFDRDGEYSAWAVQRALYTGLARWAAATELHGEISVLWTTGQFAEHKAILLDRHLLRPPGQLRPV